MGATPIPPDQLHEALAQYHYDLYKETYGVRPRWCHYDEMSVKELEEAILFLEACSADRALERREEQWMDRAASMGAMGW